MKILASLFSLGCAFSVSVIVLPGCTANLLCNKIAECEAEDGTELEKDSTSVCVAEFNAGSAAAHRNTEEACLRLADANDALNACRAGLSCRDFKDPELGGLCKEQIEEQKNATDDVGKLDKGALECTSFD
jgi:hypothetical protein